VDTDVLRGHSEDEEQVTVGETYFVINSISVVAFSRVFCGRGDNCDARAGGGLPVLVALVGLGRSAGDGFCELGVNESSFLCGGTADDEKFEREGADSCEEG
jgi:hypothetical protein